MRIHLIWTVLALSLFLTAGPAFGEDATFLDPEVMVEEATEEEATEVTVPEEIDEAVSTFLEALHAARYGAWPVFAGLMLMLIVFIMRRFVMGVIPDSALPWVSIGLGVTGTTGAALAAGEPLLQAVLAGFATGLSAIGFWEILKDRFRNWLPKPE